MNFIHYSIYFPTSTPVFQQEYAHVPPIATAPGSRPLPAEHLRSLGTVGRGTKDRSTGGSRRELRTAGIGSDGR